MAHHVNFKKICFFSIELLKVVSHISDICFFSDVWSPSMFTLIVRPFIATFTLDRFIFDIIIFLFFFPPGMTI